ncbi:MAG: LarC family nickel insertion protein [Ignavibacteriales bacterium]|nr:LarC family nickel insertion protein [Ignavibacteriales bacterium]
MLTMVTGTWEILRRSSVGSGLPDNVTALAMKIFTRIAEAEAAVHNKPVNEIHFHEVGAIDSIIDIVGSAICFTALGVEKVYVNTIELGSGMVRCEHGLLPVPAPATARIISGFPVHTGGVDFEATTPTGAAIIAALASPAPDGTEIQYRSNRLRYRAEEQSLPVLISCGYSWPKRLKCQAQDTRLSSSSAMLTI